MNEIADKPSVELLLEKLRQGDSSAAEQVYLIYEPYLRLVVRRQLSAQLRPKFDSIDVVQSVWADTLRGFRENAWHFADATCLRAFLIKAVRNRFVDRYRQNRLAVKQGRPLESIDQESALRSRQPRPSEEVEARDLWEQMLRHCPPNHRELLNLKREGLPLADIAARTGLHPSSVRRILYELRLKLASAADSGTRVGNPHP
jgi:RNA polymerase sigma factor (sigma-70 family)